jgi:hypothetical protein
MRGEPRELAVFEPGDDGRTILGRVAAKGLADELRDRGYLVIDGVDGKAHYVALNARDELANYPTGAVVEVKGSADARPTRTSPRWRAMACTAPTTTLLSRRARPCRAAIRRKSSRPTSGALEALRRAGIVERVAEGLWKVPGDLPERAAATTRSAWAAWPWS